MKSTWAMLAVLTLCAGTFAADLSAAAKKFADTGDAGASSELRSGGASSIQPLREVKAEKEEGTTRVRNLLTDIILENARIEPDSARTLHEVAREEGKGKRYTNAERLYKRGEQLYDALKEDSDKRKDKAKSKEYSEKQKICDRMKDKAGHKAKGDGHTGVNLGFVRVGKDHDMSDDWE
jgi:hypothetical protein